MSADLPQEETKEDPLLGLDDGWKDWLRPPEMPLINGHPSVSEDAALQNDSGSISASASEEAADTRVELKDDDIVNIKDENCTIDGDQKHPETFNNDDTASINSVKDESSDEKKEFEKNDDDSSLGYKTIPVKNYSSNFNTEDPAEDIYSFYQESKLDYEKQRYHQQIFNDLVENIEEKSKFSELQSKYIDFLREAAQLETFSCSKCDYQTIIKANLKTHLWLVHKQALESNIFQCTVGSCQYKTKSLSFITKHQLTHNEESSDDFHSMGFSSDDEDYEIKEKPKKRKKLTKKSNTRKRLSLSCDFCPFEGDSRESLNIHNKTHMCPDNPGRFLCYKCDYGVIQKSALQQHLFRKHNVITKGAHKFKEKLCQFCDFKTYCRQSYNIHMMKHKDPQEIKWLTCTECEFKTKHYAALRYHLKNHNMPEEQLRKYMCEVCSKKFKTKGALDVHSLRHKSISEVSKVYKCTECKFQSKFKTSLSAHMEIHRDPAYVCDICGVRSRRKYNHEMHLLTHKPDEEVEVFKCSVCTYTTKFKVSFKKHMTKGTHLGAVKRCPDRKPRIRNADGTVVVDNTCDICGATLSSSGALSTHMRVHKPVELLEVFKCPECPFETKFKGNLTAHQKKHRAPEFKCEICGLQLRTKWNHTQHLLTHKSSTECELFNCCVCSYQTKFRPYLREHLKKRHNIVTTQRPGPKPGTKRKPKPEETPAS